MLDLIFGRSSSEKILYDAAISAMERVGKKIKVLTERGVEEVVLDHHVWHIIVPGDPFSPKIMGITDDISFIYYPKHSSPYTHKLLDKCKFVTILSGEIFDEVSGRKFSAEKTNDGNPFCIKIKPTDNFRPYTRGHECYVLGHIDNCNKLLEQVCP